MADTKRVTVVVSADDQTKKELGNVSKNIKNLSDETKKTTSSTGGLKSSILQMAAGFGVAQLATDTIRFAVNALKNEFNASIQAAEKYTLAMTGLSSVSAAFGEDQNQAREAAKSLASDGLITVTTAAQGLKNLMAGGLSLDKSIELMNAYKNEAAFGRAETIEYDQAVGNLAESFLTENAMIGNLSGQQENYNIIIEAGANILGKKVSQLTEAERAEAKYLGTLIVAEKAEGDAARMTETFIGKKARLNNEIFNLRVAIGSALTPALGMLNQNFTDLIVSLIPTPQAMADIAKAAMFMAGVLRDTAIAVGGLAKAFIEFQGLRFKSAWETVKDTTKTVLNNIDDTARGISGITAQSIQGIYNVQKEAASRLGDFIGDVGQKAKDLAKSVADEVKGYERSLESMMRSFNESLRDLVFAHRDKREQLEKDISEENKSYEEKLKEREERYDKDMENLESRHEEKVFNIKRDIEEEEIALMLSERQKEAFQDDKYLKDIERSKRKLEDLKKKLQEENEAYRIQKAETESVYEKETEKIKAEHEKRLNLLQTELTLELEIYKAHQADFDALKDQVKEDDITRLKRRLAEEKAIRERDHQEKLQEMYVQGRTEQEAYYKGKEHKSAEETTRAIQEQEQRAKQEVAKVVLPEVQAPEFAPSAQISADSKGFLATIGDSISSAWKSATSWLSAKLPFFQEGGTVPGPVGMPQLAVVHGGEQVVPVGGSGGNLTVNINMGIYAGKAIEKRQIAYELWEEVGKLARAQNKQPQELLQL